jgi:hypothetical protein
MSRLCDTCRRITRSASVLARRVQLSYTKHDLLSGHTEMPVSLAHYGFAFY